MLHEGVIVLDGVEQELPVLAAALAKQVSVDYEWLGLRSHEECASLKTESAVGMSVRTANHWLMDSQCSVMYGVDVDFPIVRLGAL